MALPPPQPPEDPPRPPRRRDAARHLLHPRVMQDSLTLAKQPSLRPSALAGLQAALVAAIALPLVHLSPWSHLIGYAALGALVALFGRFAAPKRRNRIVFFAGLTQTGAVLIMGLASWLGLPTAGQMVLLSVLCGLFYFTAVSGRWGPPGAMIFVFAAGAAMTPAAALGEVLERVAAVAVVSALSWMICAVTEGWRHRPERDPALPVEPLIPLRGRLIRGGRIIGGAAIALFVGRALGAEHPSWAALGAMAVMQGAHLHLSMNRALQRMAGTVVGALLAWAILSLEPSVWTLIALICVMQYITEIVIGANYALGQIFVTPMALLMSYLAAQGALDASMAGERVTDTLLGALIGITVAVVLSTWDDRDHLARHHAERTGAG